MSLHPYEITFFPVTHSHLRTRFYLVRDERGAKAWDAARRRYTEERGSDYGFVGSGAGPRPHAKLRLVASA